VIGGLSMTELIIILGLALLLLGPDQLPTIARSLGKGLRELRKATDDIKSQFESEVARIDIDDTEKTRRMIAPAPPPPPSSGDATTPAPQAAAPDDPGAARAAARRAATAPPPAANPEVPVAPEAPLRLIAPEGTVPAPGDKT
jgi:sec-independent protein translocase protein TatB